MKKLKQFLTNKYVVGIVLVLLGWFLGKLIFQGESGSSNTTTEHTHDKETTYTCSMHPQIRQAEPGLCPICGMDLIPVESGDDTNVGPESIKLSAKAMELAQVQVDEVSRGNASKTIILQGTVQADQRLEADVNARFSGRIEQLYVNFDGEEIKAGQKLAKLYSPELLTAQQELLEAASIKESSPSLYNAVRKKLELWGLTSSQINNIESSGKAQPYTDLYSPQSGTVISKNVEEGDYFKEGTSLFKIANLNKVWVQFDVYEKDLAWINRGDKISYTISALNNESFTGKISFIDPLIGQKSRVAKARVEMNNNAGKLKPGMYVEGRVNGSLKSSNEELLVPKSAVLWTGKRAIVYVQYPDENSAFDFREVTLGAETGNYYIVKSGLTEGDKVVSNGAFKVDAAAQLAGKKSMMNNTPEKRQEKQAKWQPSEDFVKDLSNVIEAYHPLKMALSDDMPQDATEAAKEMIPLVEKMAEKKLSGDVRSEFNASKSQILKALKKIMESKSIDNQRIAFLDLNTKLINWVLVSEDYIEQEVFVQYCPMANKNNGGQWLSSNKKIENPYFGKKMHKCGAITHTIK